MQITGEKVFFFSFFMYISAKAPEICLLRDQKVKNLVGMEVFKKTLSGRHKMKWKTALPLEHP